MNEAGDYSDKNRLKLFDHINQRLSIWRGFDEFCEHRRLHYLHLPFIEHRHIHADFFKLRDALRVKLIGRQQ